MYPTSEKYPVEDLEVNIEDLDVNIVDKDPDFVCHQLLQIHPLKKIWIGFWTIVQRMCVSPIKFQMQSPVNDMSEASLRYYKRKYKEVKAAFKKVL